MKILDVLIECDAIPVHAAVCEAVVALDERRCNRASKSMKRPDVLITNNVSLAIEFASRGYTNSIFLTDHSPTHFPKIRGLKNMHILQYTGPASAATELRCIIATIAG